MDDVLLYLVRVWNRIDGFRASVRRADEEEAHVFDSPDALARFLAAPQSEPREQLHHPDPGRQ